MKKNPVYSTDNKKPAGPKAQADVDTERDLDEQIHSHDSVIGEEDSDPDDRVHNPRGNKTRQLKAEDQPNDPDDLIHENGDDEDEYE